MYDPQDYNVLTSCVGVSLLALEKRLWCCEFAGEQSCDSKKKEIHPKRIKNR